MATAAEVRAAIASALETLLASVNPTEYPSAFDQRHSRIAPGTAAYQLIAFTTPVSLVRETGANYVAFAVRTRVHYHLATGQAEAAWTGGGMQTALEALIRPSWSQARPKRSRCFGPVRTRPLDSSR